MQYRRFDFFLEDMLDKLKEIKTEFQFILDNSHQYYSLSNVGGISSGSRS